MKNILATASVGLWVLALVSGCDGGGSHADGSLDRTTPGTDATDTVTNPGTDAKDGGTDMGMGTDGGPVTCSAAGTCGGNIVGTWNITSSCLLDVDVSGTIPDDCPAATAQPVNFQLRGTITYRADLTYSRQSTFTGGVAITYPGTCLSSTDGGAPQTCAQLATELKLDVTYTDVTCVAAGTGCTCTGTLAPATSQTKTGMYTATPAGLLIETETGRAMPDTSDYCIMGSTLTTSPHAMGVAVSGTITATRAAAPDAGADAASDGGGDAKPDAVGDGAPVGGSDAAPDGGADATGG